MNSCPPAGAGHNNMECYPEYALRLREFLDHVDACQMNKTVVLEELESVGTSHPPEQQTACMDGETGCMPGQNMWCNGIGYMFQKLRLIENQEAPKPIGPTHANGDREPEPNMGC